MLNQKPVIEVYEPRPGWDRLLSLLGGPEYRVWRSVQAATPEARAQLLKRVEQWRAIERDAHPSTRDQEQALFLKRLDERTAFLVLFYPASDWLLSRVALACLLLVLGNTVLVTLVTGRGW